MSMWRDEVPTDGAVSLPPDPHALDSLGRNHSLPTALADLVDNSIDAHATHVQIRSIRLASRIRPPTAKPPGWAHRTESKLAQAA
jgi:hypothetical protein